MVAVDEEAPIVVAVITRSVRSGPNLAAADAAIGRIALFAARTIGRAVRPPYYPGRFLEQLIHIGWLSLPVVGLTALFTGAALALGIGCALPFYLFLRSARIG